MVDFDDNDFRRVGVNPWHGRPIPKEKIKEAIYEGRTMKRAAEYLYVSYNTFKKWAQYYDLWDPMAAGSPGRARVSSKRWVGGKRVGDPEMIALMDRYIESGLLKAECCVCGYAEVRESDYKYPLYMVYRDRSRKNTAVGNLILFCYNCYFLMADYKWNPGYYKKEVFNKKKAEMRERVKELRSGAKFSALDISRKERMLIGSISKDDGVKEDVVEASDVDVSPDEVSTDDIDIVSLDKILDGFDGDELLTELEEEV